MPARRLFWPALLVCGAALLLSGLSRRDLWSDEAHTALLARGVLREGVPAADDGLNVVSTETGRDLDARRVLRWAPWLQFYVEAASFAVLGESTTAARLPFALLGLCCLPLTWWWARRLFESEPLARLSAALLAVNVPFLLHARQARWYALACAASCGFLGFGIAAARDGRKRDAAGLAVCAALLFYSNFLPAGALFAAFACAVPALSPDRRGRAALLQAAAAAALLCLPGVLVHWGMAGEGASQFSWLKAARHAGGYLGWFALWLCPPPLLALALLKGEDKKGLRFLAVLCAVFVAALSFGPWRYFRYLAPLFPVGCALSAAALLALWKRGRPAALAAGALLVLTDALSAPLYPFLSRKLGTEDRFVVAAAVGSPLAGFFYELGHDFESCDRAAAAALNALAKPGQTVIATYGDLPLMFYTKGLKILGGFQGAKLPADPDWIVVQPSILSAEPGRDRDVFRFLASRVDASSYEPVPLACRSAMLGACPEPWTHEFRIADRPGLKLLRRKSVRPRLSRSP